MLTSAHDDAQTGEVVSKVEVAFLDNTVENLLGETFNKALLDCGCTRTVCGLVWLICYLQSLTKDDLKKVTEEPSSCKFKFGDNKLIKSNRKMKIPTVIAGKSVMLSTEVIHYDIPLLLSKQAMKKASTQIDFKSDTVTMYGKNVDLSFSSSGHYCIPLNDSHQDFAMFSFSVEGKSVSEKKKIAKKLHRQFVHPPSYKIKDLLKNADVNDDEMNKCVDEISDSCEICVKYKKVKPKPIVGFPLAKEFNETVAMDLKHWSGNTWLLHIIDHLTRFSASCVINSKRKEVIVKKVFQIWVAIFGHPQSFLVDNGGEFANEEFITFCENLNIYIKTTAAESPWSNGLVERHNGILGLMIP